VRPPPPSQPAEQVVDRLLVRVAQRAAEAVDVLTKIITGGPLSDANEKAIDDLLGGL
jgi:hypothetical protein